MEALIENATAEQVPANPDVLGPATLTTRIRLHGSSCFRLVRPNRGAT